MRKYQQAVTDGIKLLNKQFPRWKRRIKLEKLHMASSQHCILGQLYGSYGIGVNKIGLPPFNFTERCNHGFTTIHNFGALTREWKRQIKVVA